MSIFNIVIFVLGIFGYLFFYWKRLKEDYITSQIFSSAFYILFGAFAGSLFIQRISPGFWFWGGFLGASVGFFLGILRLRLKIFETLEAASIGLLILLTSVFLIESIRNSSWFYLGGSTALFLLIALFFFFDRQYKKFSWYKSGRVGFSGLTTLGVLFLVRSAVSIFSPNMLSFVESINRVDATISGLIAFGLFLAVFNLSKWPN